MIAQLSMMGGEGGSGGGNTGSSRVSRAGGLALHRSNSSLELPHSPERTGSTIDAQPLRREYGSHGSIDVVASQCSPGGVGGGQVSDNIFAMLQDFRSNRSGSDRFHSHHHYQYQHPHHHHHHNHHHHHVGGGGGAGSSASGTTSAVDEVCGSTSASSPKLRLKLNRLWGGKESSCPSGAVTVGNVVSSDLEERHRRRAFVHYDCQSLTANLGYAAKLRGILLARRRNTATGASAASIIRSPTPDNDGSEGSEAQDDPGDGKNNDLIESCQFFRNEIGNEMERQVSLSKSPITTPGPHRPSLAYGVSVLEPPQSETLWKHTCPMRKRLLPIESIDEGARYYRKYFLGIEHQNWFGMDEQLGPVAISIRKDTNHYRIIVRTSELLTLRGSVPEYALGLRINQNSRIPTRELIELVAPEVQINCLRLGTTSADENLAKLDEQGLSNCYKVGVLYCRNGQKTEEEMYNNQHAGPAFLEFLDTIGQRVRLKGFDGYKAGLDTRSDSTGTHTVASTYRGAQVTLHVSTMLPFTPNNRQQLLRKRHIGNDIVTIVFQEPGALPFSPRNIRSQFQHVFIIIRVINPCTDNTQYRVAVSRSKQVPIFGPPIPKGAIFNKGKGFSDFILAKVINAENAAHRSEKFSTMATRTRQAYLKDLTTDYSSTTIIDTGQKFSMLGFSSKKKTSTVAASAAITRPRLACDALQRGAICWQVILEESNQNTDCYLGISIDTIVLIEEHSRQIVYVSPCINILGWHAQTNCLRLYYHQGECISIHVRSDYSERDEIMEIVARLRAVTQGSPASELSLRRNSLGQLGFHVQPDGIVTQVESMGLSWKAGLRQGSRLVEICKVAVSTLSHDQMVDLLKTSVQVTVTVIPPTNDGQPRRGCLLQSCQYLSGNYESDYENVVVGSNNNNNNNNTDNNNIPSQQIAQQVQKNNYERSTSPPRSSNSSGYGTGSSSRSFNNDQKFIHDGNVIINSNLNSNSDERWYDLLETQEADLHNKINNSTPPPPLPVRQKNDIKINNDSPIKYYNNSNNTKESNYSSPRALHDVNNYQKFDDTNRGNNFYGHTHTHNKLTASNSLPLTSNTTGYNSPKSMTNRGVSRYNEQQYDVSASNGIEHNNNNNFDIETTNVHMRKQKNDDNPSASSTYDQDINGKNLSDKRQSSYEFFQDCYDKNINDSGDLINNHQDIAGTDTNREFIIGEKVTCLKNSLPDRALTRKLMQSEYNRSKDYVTSSLPPEVRIFSANTSENLTNLSSRDDEQLNQTRDNSSPGLRRSSKRTNPSNSSPRNQSPRPKSIVRNAHRNSANLASSTLQEDLMKLINPDYIGDDNNSTLNNNNNNTSENGNSVNETTTNIDKSNCDNTNKQNNTNKLEIQNKCRSRENLCGTSSSTLSILSPNRAQDNSTTTGTEVILTMARPATVISNSSTNTTRLTNELKLSKEDKLSPRVTKTLNVSLKPSNDLLLSTRDCKIEGDDETNNHDAFKSRQVKQQGQEWNQDNQVNDDNNDPIVDIQSQMSNLELRVARETRRRMSLEEEVRRLRDENRRLQDENHAAAQQLRRFTEWFFQTIDHQ